MSKKKRSQRPPLFSNYKSYRQYLRIEFEHRCVYCSIRESELGGSKSFHIDHYRPKKKFPNRIVDYLNLFYSCRDCNAYKGDFWPSLWQKCQGHFILNPCDHDIDKHLDCSGKNWVAKSSTGSWHLNYLKLNSPLKINKRESREIFLSMISKLEQQKQELQIYLHKLENNESQCEIQQKIFQIQKEINMLILNIQGPMD